MGQGKSLAPAVVLFGRLSPGILQIQNVSGLLGVIPAPDLVQDPFPLRGQVWTSCPWSPSTQSQVLWGSFLPSLAPKLEKELFRQPSLEGAGNVTFGAGQGRKDKSSTNK